MVFTGCYGAYQYRPINKNKAGDVSDNNNFLPIALVKVASKLFESLIVFPLF